MTVNWFILVATALAAGVEFVEAFTIVLAVGVTRGWRSALLGAVSALVVLAIIVAIFGVEVLQVVPLGVLKVIIGVFLLLFGLKWLRAALLRYGGRKALRDEAAAFQREVATLRDTAGSTRRIDWSAFTTSFNGTFLEMLEAALIVIALGSAGKAMPSAIVGAVGAAAIVAVAGFLLRSPLERVPENTMKFIVGIMLTTFGSFWLGEGAGITWWHSDAVIPILIGIFLIASWVAVLWLKRTAQAAIKQPTPIRRVG